MPLKCVYHISQLISVEIRKPANIFIVVLYSNYNRDVHVPTNRSNNIIVDRRRTRTRLLHSSNDSTSSSGSVLILY